MNKYLTSAAGVLAATTLLLATAPAMARVDVDLNIGVPGVYVQPQPVYVQPRTVYVQPAPVYVQERPVYIQRDREDDEHEHHDHGRHHGHHHDHGHHD